VAKKKRGRKPTKPGSGDLLKQKITRSIDGELWSIAGTSSGRKDVATNEAKQLRADGIRARVIPTKAYGHSVYKNIKDTEKHFKRLKRKKK